MPRAMVLCLIVAMLGAAPGLAQTEGPRSKIEVHSSTLFESFLLLNAASSNQKFNLPEVEARWSPLIHKDKQVEAAFVQWQGQGLGLCYLFTDYSARPPARLSAALAQDDLPFRTQDMKENDPYLPLAEQVQQNPQSLKIWLDFVASQGAPPLPGPSALEKAQQQSDALEQKDWRDPLEQLLGLEHARTLPIYLTKLSRRPAFLLQGRALGLAESALPQMKLLVPKEVARKFQPNPINLSWLKWLGQHDPYYQRASKRIHDIYGEDPDDEFITAAYLYAATRSELISHKQALLVLRNLYPNPSNPADSGSPLAAILYSHLMENRGQTIHYAIWLETESHRKQLQAGQLQAAYEQVTEEVKGSAGLSLDGNLVTAVTQGQPAAAAGLHPGDRLLDVNGYAVSGLSTEGVMEHLLGPIGAERTIKTERATFTIVLR